MRRGPAPYWIYRNRKWNPGTGPDDPGHWSWGDHWCASTPDTDPAEYAYFPTFDEARQYIIDDMKRRKG